MLQKIAAMRSLRWGLLPSLLAVGVVGGYIAHEAFLAPYRAHVVVDLADVQSFKRAESLLRSDETAERFARTHGLERDPAIIDFINQLSLGRNKPVELDFSFPLTRGDVKNLPEAVAREMFKDVKLRPLMDISLRNKHPEEAVRRVNLIRAYVRDTLLRSALTDFVQTSLTDAKVQLATLQTKKTADRRTAESLARQIKAMREIQNEHQAARSNTSVATANTEIIQVPTNDIRFLSPERQLIGLETQDASLAEQMLLTASREAQVTATEQFASSLANMAGREPDATKLVRSGLAMLAANSATAPTLDEKLAIDQARSEMSAHLLALSETYAVNGRALREPIVQREGPSLTSTLGGGAVLGFVIWFFLFRLLNEIRARSKKLHSDVVAIDNIQPVRRTVVGAGAEFPSITMR
jgi:hypothetical protein